MIKKAIAVAAIAASAMGTGVAMAPQAMAIGDDSGPSVANGNGAMQNFGNSATYGNMSPQMALIQGSFNKPCIAVDDIPVSVLNLVPIQGLSLLSDESNQQCTENSTQAKRDGALSHLLEDVSILSANGES
ncbi:rodlin [Streptomyces sp. NPDC029526]|uniref:rodlin n=1 Tax=Streptomyces sp. NPDC029526 TaxID=3155728 RepID=UPI0033DB7ACC